MQSIEPFVEQIAAVRRRVSAERAVLAAVSGIDGCGKGYVAELLAEALARRDLRTAAINIDGWLNLPSVRFDRARPAEIFYERAIRFDELFDRLLLPLRDRRRIELVYDHAAETATAYEPRRLAWDDVDVVLVEGIYLLRRDLVGHYDASLWIECSFDSALERALARGQEGLGREATIEAYRTIYFPAQEIHFARDQPRAAASATLINDPRLAT